MSDLGSPEVVRAQVEPDLPTTIDIVRRGTQQYHDVLASIQRRHFLRDGRPLVILQSRWVTSFTGIEPHVTISVDEGGFYNSLTSGPLASIFAAKAPDMLIHTRQTKPGSRKKIDLINLRALSHIASKHVKYFPDEAISSPTEWVRAWLNRDISAEDPDTRSLNSIRMGLLIGCPLGSVLKHPQYLKAIGKVARFEDGALLSKLITAFQYPNVDAAPKGIRGKVVEALGNNLTPEERQVILIARAFDYPLQGGVSLDGQADLDYQERLKTLIEQSGIYEVRRTYLDIVGDLLRAKERRPTSIMKHSWWLAKTGRWSLIPWSIRETLKNEERHRKAIESMNK